MSFNKLFIFCLFLIGSITVHSKQLLSIGIQEDSKSWHPTLSIENNYPRIITYQLAYNLMFVKAFVNGKYGNFIVDTGAETLILNEKYFTGTENNQNHAVDFNGAKVKYQEANVKFGWSFDEEKTKFAIITDISLMEKIIGSPIMGYIGYNILKDYEITFDSSKRTIMLVELDRKGNYINTKPSYYNLIDIIQLNENGCKPYLVAHSKGKRLKLAIDTGASWSILSEKAVKILKQEFQWEKSIKSIAFNGKIYESKKGVLHSLNIKNNIYYSIKVIVTNKWNSGSSYRKNLDGLLGNDFLHQKIIGINFIKKELYLFENKIEVKSELMFLAKN